MMAKFGQKLSYLRHKKELTQRQLAAILEVDHSFISQLERGMSKPSVNMILKIADLFSVTTDFLMKDDLDLEA